MRSVIAHLKKILKEDPGIVNIMENSDDVVEENSGESGQGRVRLAVQVAEARTQDRAGDFTNVSARDTPPAPTAIVEIQDSIAGVIETMSFDNEGEAAAQKFRNTGRFTMNDLKAAIALIPPHQHVALLGHLHITAEIVPAESSDTDPVLEDEQEYIMPWVLENTSDQELDLFHKKSCESCFVEPLLIYFSCGFTPMGLFPAAMACFISNKSFVFIREGVKKNMVQFLYGTNKVCVTLISRRKYFEVIVHVNLVSKTPFTMNVPL